MRHIVADDAPISRWQPKPPKTPFRWLNDPAERFRGKGATARISREDAKGLVDYNSRLYSPGSDGLIQNGAPDTPSATAFPGSRPGWETPSAADAQRIGDRYASGPTRFATNSGTGFYPTAPRATVRSAPTTDSAPTIPAPLPLATTGEGFEPTGNPQFDNPNVAPVVPAPNPALNVQSDLPTGGPQADIVSRAGVHPITGQPLPGDKSIQQQEAERIDRLRAQGASDATIHRAQVAGGTRPEIDARATQSPLNSTTSAQIQAKWAKERADRLANLKNAATN